MLGIFGRTVFMAESEIKKEEDYIKSIVDKRIEEKIGEIIHKIRENQSNANSEEREISFKEAITQSRKIKVKSTSWEWANEFISVSDMLYHLSMYNDQCRYTLINKCKWYVEI